MPQLLPNRKRRMFSEAPQSPLSALPIPRLRNHDGSDEHSNDSTISATRSQWYNAINHQNRRQR
ncbi:hypothetical protein LTR37_008292 [Vermiconidia calcicola]|uniref:Uncharacterized protein n=1 Tax=Vermiconidia calcicola TaxID=1690605 RepID=A0ACC3NBQ5_9PEZI|nr:hypothetical protein LTR37_008292 [Vermiconidia calcicola]